MKTYKTEDGRHLEFIKNQNEFVKKLKIQKQDFEHFLDLMYLELLLDMRDFEKQMKSVVDIVPFITYPFNTILNTYIDNQQYYLMDRDPKIEQIKNNFYDMWEELNTLSFTLES